MKDAENKNVNQDVTPEQMPEVEDENERELADRQLKDVVGGIIEVRGPAHNPFA